MPRYAVISSEESILSLFKSYVQSTYSESIETVMSDYALSFLDKQFPEAAFFRSKAVINLVDAESVIGATVLLAPEIVDPSKTDFQSEKLNLSDYRDVIDRLVESKAKERGNKNIVDAISWQSSTVKRFKKEAVAFITWRDVLFNTNLQEAKAMIQAGTPMDIDVFIAGLPLFEDIFAATVI